MVLAGGKQFIYTSDNRFVEEFLLSAKIFGDTLLEVDFVCLNHD